MITSKLKFFLFSAALLSGAVQAQVKFGAVGDSMTDEYLDSGTASNTDLAAYNWVEIVGRLRSSNLNLGQYRAPGSNDWPDHRAGGYQYDYAKVAGAASNNARMSVRILLIPWSMKIDSSFVGSRYVSDQVTGLLTEGVQYAVVGAGSNDYYYKTHTFDAAGKATRNSYTPTSSFNADIANSLLNHVDRLKAAGVKVLLASIPLGTAGGDGDVATINGIKAANALLVTGAAQRGVPMVDFFGFPQAADGSVTVGGLTIARGTKATSADLVPAGTAGAGKCRSDNKCAGPTHKNRYIADDGLHPNTIIQGLMANQVIGALNAGYGLGIAPLSDAEILSLTGN